MSHICHWQGCKTAVPPKLFMCAKHWFMLPHGLRRQIWATYRAGQEIDKRPSAEYMAAAEAVQEWIRSEKVALT